MQLAQAVGQVFKGQRAVLEVDAALELGILERAVRFHLEGGGSAGGEVGIEGLGELEVDGAAGGQVELLRSVERQAALGAQVGVFAGDVQRIEADAVVGEGGVDAALAFEMNAGDGGFQLLQAGFAAKLLGMGERAFDGDRAGQRGFAAEGLDVGKLEQRIDVEAGELEPGLGLRSRRRAQSGRAR